MNFKERVHKAVKQIPKGQVRTYKDIAIAAGSPRAFRAVGQILKQNYDPAIPCHRVIHSDGRLGAYNRGQELKRQLLTKEGYLKN